MNFLSQIKLNPTPLQRINSFELESKQINLLVKRIDLIHPFISGNKWFKLKYNLIEAHSKGYDTLLSFGGAYSNHIYALAAAGSELGFKTIGVIRGEEHLPLNPTLTFAKGKGMLLHYVNRSTYRDKYSGKLLEELKNRFGNFYLIPEGGSNELAIKGCGEILNDIEIDFNYVCTACGTAGTIAGIISTLNKNSAAIGFSVLKSASFLNDNVNTLLGKINLIDRSRWRINLDYHFGGYAKIDQALVKFIDDFQSSHNIQLDPVYTGKMMFGIFDLIRNDFFSKGSTIIAIHTGGLQGIDGMKSKIDRIRDYNSHQLF